MPLIRRLSAGCTLLLVEHDMGVVFDLADRIAVLVQGELLALDTPARVRADPRVQAAYLGGLAGAVTSGAAGGPVDPGAGPTGGAPARSVGSGAGAPARGGHGC